MWRDLISTLLAEHGVHMAMFALDPDSQVSARLSQAGVFGSVLVSVLFAFNTECDPPERHCSNENARSQAAFIFA